MKCYCDNIPFSLEVKTPGRNRGRWYLKCPTGTCKFFAWDESPHPFIRHRPEVYASIPLRANTRPYAQFISRLEQKEVKSAITKARIPVAFSVLSKDLIGIKAESNLTLEPVFAGIENIEWSDKYDQWTIPATVPMYNLAIASLPKDIPNLQIEIEPIPPIILDSIIERTFLEANAKIQDTNEMTDMEFKWTEFVESDLFRSLKPIQRDAVLFGLERNGRVLFGNENGIGSIGEALALTKVYQDEWPVLVTCPSILCHTWKHEIMTTLGLEQDEIFVLDSKAPTSETFKQVGLKRKSDISSFRISYKKRIERRLNEDGYKSSDSEDENEIIKQEDEEADEEKLKQSLKIKFYISSHEHAAKRRKEIKGKGFRIMICADSHYLKSWTKGESKFICQLLQKHRRVILTSDSVRYRLPKDLFTQIHSVAPTLFPDLDRFFKRYCDPKNTVFGYSYIGRSNECEFKYLLDTNVWYAPMLPEIKPSFPDIVRQNIIFSIKKSNALKCQVEDIIRTSNNCEIVDEELVETLHLKTAEIKQDDIIQYIDYVVETYKRPKIAIVYQNNIIFKAITEYLKTKKIRITHLDNTDNATTICEEYNKSHAVQFIFVDMKLDDLNVSLNSVDLVIFTEIPFENEKLHSVESLFKFNQRKGPLSIKYLIALQTIDDYLWPLVKT